jgi:hypothetical protein
MNKKVYVVLAMLIVASLACSALDDEPTAVPTKASAATLVPTKAGAATVAPAATKPAAQPTVAAQGGFETVKDSTGAIQIDMPTEWKDRNLKPVDLGDTKTPLPSARIAAATNLKDFYDYKANGAEFIASGTLARLGGYLQVLDFFRSGLMKECKYDKRYTYADKFYEGSFDLFLTCNGIQGQELVLFSGRPVENKFAHLVLLQVNFTKAGTSQQKVDVLKALLDSFDVIGTLPK